MVALDIFVALAIFVGLCGVLVPMLPGSALVGGSILVWAAITGGSGAWATFVVAALVLALGSVIKYLVPGKRLKDSGIPNSTLLAGGILGIIGFFVVPVVGLPLGFVLGIYLTEWNRLSQAEAWPATVQALKAVGLGMLIELAFCLAATAVWIVGVVAA